MENIDKLLDSSLASMQGPAGDLASVLEWMKRRNKEIIMSTETIPFSSMDRWKMDKATKNFTHESGKFFSIEGLKITKGNGSKFETWSQPIINQPEIGILGIIAQVIDGTLCFLLQAKVEPGNINGVQLSPTLQATRSNYMRVHGGSEPKYLEFFTASKSSKIIIDQLQSEQGSRFLSKRNRNIILLESKPVPENKNYIWVTLGQIKALVKIDNIINMDTRSVISGIFLGKKSRNLDEINTAQMRDCSHKSMTDILSWLAFLKTNYSLMVERIPLVLTDKWIVESDQITRDDKRYFRIFGIRVSIEGREVKEWCQPIFQPMHPGICGFVLKKINDIPHFLVQAKIECGNLDVVELAPTVQCLTGGYEKFSEGVKFLDLFLEKKYSKLLMDVMQSEEGGRFYHEQNRNMIVEVDETFAIEIPDNFYWITYQQLMVLMHFNNYLNIQSRSLLAGYAPMSH